MSWLELGDLEGTTNRLLTVEEELGLRRICIPWTYRRSSTTATLRRELKLRRDEYWFPVPFATIAAVVLHVSILVWEPCGELGTHSCVYKDDDHSGIFFDPSTARCIQMLYSGCSRADGKGYLVRDPRLHQSTVGVTEVSVHNHYDRIYLEFDWQKHLANHSLLDSIKHWLRYRG